MYEQLVCYFLCRLHCVLFLKLCSVFLDRKNHVLEIINCKSILNYCEALPLHDPQKSLVVEASFLR